MSMKEILQDRFDELGISGYELTRRVVELRTEAGEETSIDKLKSSVAKTLKDPDGRRYSAIAEVIEAMGGEIFVRWKDYKDVKAL